MTVLLCRLFSLPIVAFFATLQVSLHFFCANAFAQSSSQALQPKYIGLPGRTVWALATTGSTTVTTFAATDKGLWRSTNNGQTWTETTLKNQGVYAVKSRRVGNTATLLAGTDRGVLRSIDNGATWTSPEVTTGTMVSTSNILSLKKVFDIEVVGNFWFAATEKGVFRSNNDGRSWSLVNIDRTADNNEVRGITTDGNTIIVNLWREGLWRSTNNGNTWSKLTIAGETSLAKSVFAHTGILWVQQGNRTTTANVSMLFVGAVSGNLWRSTDNGTSWTKTLSAGTAQRSVSSAPTGVDVVSAIGTRLVSGTPNGFAVSDDNGTTWRDVRTSLQQPISLASDNQNIYVGLQQSSSTAVGEKSASSLSNTSPGVGTFTTSSAQSSSSCAIPNVNSFTPASVLAGGAAMSVTINGSGFESGTQYRVLVIDEVTGNQLYLQTLVSGQVIGGIGVTYNNANSSTLSLSTAILARASRIGVTPYSSFACGNQAGPGYTFYVETRIPTVTSISPTTVLRNTNNPPATVFGTNFEAGSKVYLYHQNLPGGKLELATTFVDANTLQTFWSSGIFFYIGTAPSVEVGVENPSGGVSPSRQTLTIVNPLPYAGGLSPTQISAGASTQLFISGSGYFEGSQVSFNGQTKPATFLANGSLRIQLTPSDIPTAGTYPVVVTNPAPGGGSTEPMNLNVLNPTPFVTAVSPQTLSVGQDATLTVSGGSSFVSGAFVWHSPSNTPLTTTFVNSNTLTVDVPASLLTTPSETGFAFRVFNPAPGGGGSSVFTMPVRNAAPTLTGVSPNTLIAASQDVALTLTGSNFLAGAQVLLSGSVPLAATVVNGSTITATLPAQYANAVGTYSIIVRNPDAVGDSQPQTLSVVYPQAQLSAVAPNPVPAQNAALNLTLTGSSFIAGAQVRILDDATSGQQINQILSTSVQSASSITATLPQTLTERIERYRLSVENPAPNSGAPGYITFDVLALTPTLTAIAPTTATMTGSAQALTLTGTNFVALQNGLPQTGTSVEINGQALAAAQWTVQSATQIALTLPVEMLDSAKVFRIRVVNPTVTVNGTPQGGGASAERTFTLTYPVPTLSSLTPQVFTLTPAAPSASVFTLTGTNFAQASRVLVRRTGASSVDTLAASPGTLTGGLATSLTLTLPASYLASATTYTVQVLTRYGSIPNGFVSGGTSAPQTLTVQNPLPAITALTPAESLVQQTTTLTITGTNFVAPSLVNSNRGTLAYLGATALLTTVLSPTTLLVTIASTVIPTAQAYSLTVRNPLVNGLGGGTSNGVTFTALNPTALLGSLAVQTGTLPLAVSSATQTVLLTGQFFVSGLSVTLSRTGGNTVSPQTLTATWISSTQVSLSIPTVFLAEAGTLSLRVSNPVPTALPTGGQSNLISAAIHNPHPRLLTLTPTTATVSASDVALTLNGTNFLPNSSIIVTGKTLLGADTTITLPPASYSPINATPTSLTSSIPTNFVALAGTYRVWVQNPAPTVNALGQSTNGISDTLQFSMLNPVPTLTAIAPTIVATGSNDTTITLMGTNFTPLSSVLLNGTTLATSRVVIQDRQTILATVPAALMTSATVINVQVRIPAPGGGTTIARTLTVRNAAPVLDSIAPAVIAAQRDTVITAYGAGFNLTSQFRLTRGTTTVTLAIVSLPASGIAQLRIPAAAVITLATYQVRVFNSAPGGGTSVSRNLVVQPGAPMLTEFVGVSTTAVVAGGTLPAFTVRLRDALGNLTDVTTASLTLPIQFSNRTSLLGVSSGTLVLTRSSLGVYTTTATRFSLADSYHFFANNFSSISGLSTTGTRTFTVIPAADSRVTISGVSASTDAGDVLPTFSLRFEDAFGNLTDNGIGRLTYARVGGSSTATLAMTRVSTGIYTAQSTVCTIAGTYNLAMVGITAANTLGTKSFVIVSGAAVSASVSGLTYSLNAGSLQSAFDVRFSDVYGNFTDRNVPTSVQFTNSTNAVNGVSTGTVTLVARIGIGLYDAARVTLTTAGNYAVTHASMTMLGNRLFVVRPLAVTKIVVDVPNNMAITLGDVNAAITVIYKDRFNNGSEPVSFPATLQYTGLNVASTGTLELVRTTTATGVLSGTAKARPSALTMIGDYRIDLPAAGFPIAGIQTIRVIGREPERAEISGLPESLCGASGDIDVTLRFFDALGMPTNYYPTSVRYALFRGGVEVQQGMLEYVAEIAPGVLRYRLRAPFAPGEYRLRIPSPTIVPEDVTGTVVMEVCSPPAALSVVGANISPGVNGSTSCIVAGQSLTGLRVNVLDAFGLNTFGVAALSAQYQGITCVSSGTLTLVSTATRGVFLEAAPPTIFTTAGTYRLTVSTNGSFSATTLGTFCVEPDAPSRIKLLSTPLTCVTAGNTLGNASAPLALRITDQFGNTSGTVSQATFSADAPIVSTGTLQLRTSTTGVVTQAPPLAIFSTAATYTLTLPVSYRGNAVSLPPVSFCVQPAPAAVGTLSLVLPAIPQNSTQASLLTVRDYWGNLTTTTSTVLNFSGAASGRIALTPQSTGIYRGANTQFATQGTYSLQAGTLEMRGQTTFSVVPRPTITALSPMINNTTLATFIAWTMTVTGTGFTPDSEVRILDVANNLINTKTVYSDANPTQLRYIVPESQADRSGVFAVTVVNPHGQGGTSASVLLRITPRINANLDNSENVVFGSDIYDRNLPISSAFPNDAVTILIPGSGFHESSEVLWNNVPLPSTQVSVSLDKKFITVQLTAAQTAGMPTQDQPIKNTIIVRNTTQATLTSNAATFNIIKPFQFTDATITTASCNTPLNVSFVNGQFRMNGQQEFPIGWLAQEHIGTLPIPGFNQQPTRFPFTNVVLHYQNVASELGYVWFTGEFTKRVGEVTKFQVSDEMDLIIPLAIQYLNGLQRIGLKAIMDVPREYPGDNGRYQAGSPRPLAEIARFINALKNHCAVLGWYIADEPEDFNLPGTAGKHFYKDPTQVRLLYNTVKQADPNHPVFVISFAPSRFVDIETVPGILNNYDTFFYNPSLSRFYDVILRENAPFFYRFCSDDPNEPCNFICQNPNVPCFDMFTTNFQYQYQQRLGKSYIDIPSMSAIGLAVSEANTPNLVTRAPSVLERYANNFSSIYFAQLNKSTTRQPNIAAMIFNSFTMAELTDHLPGTPVTNSTGAALSFIEFFMQNNLDKIIASAQGNLSAFRTFLPQFPMHDHQMLVMEREWGDSFYIIAVNMVNDGSAFQTVPTLELSWRSSVLLQTTVTPMIPTGMPAYTAPTLVQVGNPLDLDYVLTDNTPFQPAETRIYRIRKSGMVLAEKSVSSFSGFNSTMQQQAGLRAKERSKELALSISPNPTEEESAISFMLPTAQSIRLILTDIFGRTVQTMYEGKVESGESVFVAHLQNLPSGTYWVRLFTETGVVTTPLSLRK